MEWEQVVPTRNWDEAQAWVGAVATQTFGALQLRSGRCLRISSAGHSARERCLPGQGAMRDVLKGHRHQSQALPVLTSGAAARTVRMAMTERLEEETGGVLGGKEGVGSLVAHANNALLGNPLPQLLEVFNMIGTVGESPLRSYLD